MKPSSVISFYNGALWLRYLLLLCLLTIVELPPVYAQARPFITTWRTTNTGTSTSNSKQIRIPATGSNYYLAWEKVGDPDVKGSGTFSNTSTITFPSEGDYRISISPGAGTFTRINFSGRSSAGADKLKILSIDQWGDIPWISMENAFLNCANLNSGATDSPDLSLVTTLAGMFNGATAFNGDIGNWNTANVTNMEQMFRNATAFNGDIGNWNTEKVTNMSLMFYGASAFNSDIGGWVTTNVATMYSMFSGATAFNQNIGGWATTNVTNMEQMFAAATAFNQDIGGWVTTNVTNMSQMFGGATAFNQNIGGWATTNVTNMAYMFSAATAFNQDIGGWVTTNVTNMTYMFYRATAFNQNIGGWVTTNVTNTAYMFSDATAFNQNIGGWTLNNTVDLTSMFSNSGLGCENYTQTLTGWAANPQTPGGRSLGAAGRKYGPAAASARAGLITKGWIITDDGLDENCVVYFELSLAGQVNPSTCRGTGSINFNASKIPDGTYSLGFKKDNSVATAQVTVNGTNFALAGITAGKYSDFSITAAGYTGYYNKAVMLTEDCDNAAITSAQTGFWSTPATWTSSTVPNSANAVRILSANTVTLDGTGEYSELINEGTLQGKGTLTGDFTNAAGGTLSPGQSPGCLIFDANFTNQGKVVIEAAGTTACSDFDQISVRGTAVLGGTLEVSIGYTVSQNDVITFLSAGSLNGTFSAVSPALPANWTVRYNYPNEGQVSLLYYDSALPVRLESFKARVFENRAQLSWSVAEAVNFSHFEVERSREGRNFELVERVNYKESIKHYTFSDPLSIGITYYRLRLTDLDGSYAYSSLRAVRLEGDELAAYPNPVQQWVAVSVSQALVGTRISVISITGVELKRQMIDSTEFGININEFLPGVYIIRTQDGRSFKVVKK